MKFLTIFLLSSLMFSKASFSKGYFGRFWRGEEKTSYKKYENECQSPATYCFDQFVNDWLIPATPSYAARDALTGYAPVLLPSKLRKKFHDEFALILYSSADEYYYLRGTKKDPRKTEKKLSEEDKLIQKEGVVYSPIHGEIFKSKKLAEFEGKKVMLSRSLVPKVFQGKIQLEGPLKDISYDLYQNQLEIPKLKGLFFINERSKNVKVRDYLKALEGVLTTLQKNKTANAAYVLINQDYISAYLFFSDVKKRDEFLGGLEDRTLFGKIVNNTFSISLIDLKKTKTKPLTYTKVGRGQGGNLIFTRGQKPGNVEHPFLD